MNREEISAISHADHPIKAPLHDDSVRALLARALPRGDERLLDLGCGSAEWLLRALEGHPDARAVGVDISTTALAEARERAARRGVADRLELHQVPAADFAAGHGFDVVLSVGAVHAFGGLLATVEAAGRHLAPGGRILVGDGFWQSPPTEEVVEMMGDSADLAGTLELLAEAGWTTVHGHVSSRAELDGYEWACWGSLASWALDHPEDPEAAEVLALSSQRYRDWTRLYRDCWGFVTLILRRTPEALR
ncbi:SAM-dependent methyltransferase [Streptacidiphilus rugosus]|uniref:SAM-dependent methyltransferase n=1 Tax=Streptacidiphilus rugosus TaxID=405783 RepID=UPI00056153EE|nr:class I SAM-dependent methyltransferase [Streptacidiphilus rugosus]